MKCLKKGIGRKGRLGELNILKKLSLQHFHRQIALTKAQNFPTSTPTTQRRLCRIKSLNYDCMGLTAAGSDRGWKGMTAAGSDRCWRGMGITAVGSDRGWKDMTAAGSDRCWRGMGITAAGSDRGWKGLTTTGRIEREVAEVRE